MTASPDSLTHRMRARVNAARRAVDRRAKASRPRVQRTRRARSADPAGPSLVEDRETESLKQVFRDLAVLYRRYRTRMGGPVAPGLRAATDQFRAKPSLAALVAVAAILDQLDLLT
jgi:hypothetical protein